MGVRFGGFGVQGFLSVPFLRALKTVRYDGGIVVNGLGGFYAIASEKLGETEAFERLKEFLKRFWEEMWMAEREWLRFRRRRGYKPLAVRYCYEWAVKESTRSWKDFLDLLEGINGSTDIGVEYFDIEGPRVGVFRGDARKAAMMSVAFLEIFPPVGGRYLSTTYLSQIPVVTAKEGDVVLDNLRDTSEFRVKKADEILSQSAEIRAITLARKMIERKKLKTVKVKPIDWSDIGRIDEYTGFFLEKLEGLL